MQGACSRDQSSGSTRTRGGRQAEAILDELSTVPMFDWFLLGSNEFIEGEDRATVCLQSHLASGSNSMYK